MLPRYILCLLLLLRALLSLESNLLLTYLLRVFVSPIWIFVCELNIYTRVHFLQLSCTYRMWPSAKTILFDEPVWSWFEEGARSSDDISAYYTTSILRELQY